VGLARRASISRFDQASECAPGGRAPHVLERPTIRKMTAIRFPKTVGEPFSPELELHLGAVTLRGTSVAARATAFAVPEFGVALDVGRMSPTIAAQPVVLLSHGHLDHLSGVLAYLNVRARFHTGEPTRLVVPESIARPLGQALALMPGMESVRKRLRLDEVIVGVTPGERVAVPGGTAVPFAMDHGIETLGWALRKPRGRRPVLVYAADGSTEPFFAEPGLLDAGVAVVECTFLERNRKVAARIAKHCHVSDWVDLAPKLRCDHLVLAHLPPMPGPEISMLLAPLAKRLPGRLVAWSTAE
jgi:ribonuclease BN (tRNA processing enzyme)